MLGWHYVMEHVVCVTLALCDGNVLCVMLALCDGTCTVCYVGTM